MKAIARWIGWALLLGIALQLFFVARIAMMASVDPASTAF
ncbi:MAG: monofunctional biosynthetic peptidoglycan transglycosylase, partial [Comamonas sp.]|nr:monofunctional biosynthetic peptidoglycan transglycosylase [Comamonas sp.]